MTSVVVVAAICLIALYQPKYAYAAPQVKALTSKIENASKAKAVELKLVGVRGKVNNYDIASLENLLRKKEEQLFSSFKIQPEQLYIVYQNFTDNFQAMTVTMGYDSRILRGEQQTYPYPKGKTQLLLAKHKHTSKELLNAWNKIDYSRPIKAVIEINYLAEDGSTLSAELKVLY
ncbi:hypothetical protein SOPP22_03485 [Shewanella sp. OPT22]|nr:hypothetical protein SOPP22_03485 [Shewanella sp. OPT22]